jgi:hypothetical protein
VHTAVEVVHNMKEELVVEIADHWPFARLCIVEVPRCSSVDLHAHSHLMALELMREICQLRLDGPCSHLVSVPLGHSGLLGVPDGVPKVRSEDRA